MVPTRYLLSEQSNNFLNLVDIHIEAAMVCATYLSFSSLDPAFEPDSEALRHESVKGSYVFLDYAVLSWIHHALKISSPGMHASSVDATALGKLASCLQRMIEKRGQSFPRIASAKVLQPSFRIFKEYAGLLSSLCSIAYFMGRAEHGLLEKSCKLLAV
jgi:hypothetical protein